MKLSLGYVQSLSATHSKITTLLNKINNVNKNLKKTNVSVLKHNTSQPNISENSLM